MLSFIRSSPALLRLVGSALLLTLASLVAGCGDGSAKDSISGTVKTSAGDNVSGTVVFVAGGKEAQGPLLDGKYKVDNPPKGDCDVLVKGIGGPMGGTQVNVPKDTSKMPGNETGKTGVAPNQKYAHPGVLPKYKFTGGKQTHNITLDP
jgi:hypothetical protein